MTPRPSDFMAVEHDLDGIPSGATPTRSIVICSPPGAADAPVADLLRRCGAGVPLEYFDIDAVAAPLSRRWRVINLDDYIAALHAHRSADSGVFGLVLRWQQLRRLHRQVAGLKQITAERMLTIATTIAPNPTFLLLRSAAPEHASAAQDAVEGQEVAEGVTGVDDDARAVAERHALREATEQAWLQWFAMSGVRPLQITVGPDGELDAPVEHLVEALRLTAPTDGLGVTAARELSRVEAGLPNPVRSDLDAGRSAVP